MILTLKYKSNIRQIYFNNDINLKSFHGNSFKLYNVCIISLGCFVWLYQVRVVIFQLKKEYINTVNIKQLFIYSCETCLILFEIDRLICQDVGHWVSIWFSIFVGWLVLHFSLYLQVLHFHLQVTYTNSYLSSVNIYKELPQATTENKSS